MKNLFKQAHQMTREIAEKYEVDYQAQFGLCVSYLLETEEGEALEEDIKKQLKEVGVSQDDIEIAGKKLERYSTLTSELIEDLYEDADIRRRMKANNLWDSKSYPGRRLEVKERYAGKGNIEITNQVVWAKYGKVRIYLDVTIDEVLKIQRYITIK